MTGEISTKKPVANDTAHLVKHNKKPSLFQRLFSPRTKGSLHKGASRSKTDQKRSDRRVHFHGQVEVQYFERPPLEADSGGTPPRRRKQLTESPMPGPDHTQDEQAMEGMRDRIETEDSEGDKVMTNEWDNIESKAIQTPIDRSHLKRHCGRPARYMD